MASELLLDRVAVVTGGGYGLGRVIALTLAREGAHVVVAARNVERLERTAADIQRLGRRGLAVVTDITDEAQVVSMVERTVAELGPVDILVNNAAITAEWKPIVETSLEYWNQAIAVNLTGAMLCARECLKQMLPQKRGAIVNIAGTGARQGVANMGPHSSSKFGLIGLTQSLAMEVAGQGVRVNAVCPWAVEGEHLRQINENRVRQGEPDGDHLERLNKASPMGRIVRPEEVAETVVFLASDLSGAITGQTIDVTTGVTMH